MVILVKFSSDLQKYVFARSIQFTKSCPDEQILGGLLNKRNPTRSSRLQILFKIGVLKNFTIFTGKH